METPILYITLFLLFVIVGYYLGEKIFFRKRNKTTVIEEPTEQISDETREQFKEILRVLNEMKDSSVPPIQIEKEDFDPILKESVDEVITTMELNKQVDSRFNDASIALKRLGYKVTDIKRILKDIRGTNPNLETEEIITKALSMFT